jgi:hypothetical protein
MLVDSLAESWADLLSHGLPGESTWPKKQQRLRAAHHVCDLISFVTRIITAKSMCNKRRHFSVLAFMIMHSKLCQSQRF